MVLQSQSRATPAMASDTRAPRRKDNNPSERWENKPVGEREDARPEIKQLTNAQSNAGQMSKKKLSDVGTVVATNYYECNSIRLQLITLQGIIKEYQKIQAGLK